MNAIALIGADPRLSASLAAAFAAAALLVFALVRQVPRHASSADETRESLPLPWRLAWPLIRLFEGVAGATIGPHRRVALQGRLQRAGYPRRLTPARYRAACWVAALAGTALTGFGWLVLAAALAPSAGPVEGRFAALVLGAGLGAVLPVSRLRDRVLARQRSMLRQLPFFLDLVTMSVEAGLNLGAALAQAVDRGQPGPMRDEFAQLLRELRTGRARDEAMRALAERVQLPAVTNLVAALGIAHKQGASLGPILRAQAEQRRTERFLRAEKLAMEAPVKMLLPLVLFIFPGTFAVLLFPVLSRLLAEGVL